MTDIKYKFDLNLRRMAIHTAALLFWNTNDIQSKLKEYLFRRPRGGIKEYLIELINEVVGKIDRKSLPDLLYCEIILVVKDIGFKKSDWFRGLRRHAILPNQSRWQIYDKFYREIYWTHYGTINEMKILKDFWMTNPSIDNEKKFGMACIYCEEALIKDLWKTISEEEEELDYEFYSYRPALHIVAYWIKLLETDLTSFMTDVIESNVLIVDHYKVNESAEINMLRLSVEKGYVSAVKYFWNKISENERDTYMVECFNLTLSVYRYYDKLHNEFYKKEKYTEIAMFFLNIMTDDSRRIIFTDLTGGIDLGFMKKKAEGVFLVSFFMLFRMWPWHQFFPTLFEEVKNYLGVDQYVILVNAILHEINENYRFGLPAQQSISEAQLQQVWRSIPSFLRAKVCEELNWELFWKTKNLKIIKLILNDINLTSDEKQIFLKNNHLNILGFAKDDEKLFFGIINEVVIFKQWDEKIQESLKLLYKFVFRGEMTFADNRIHFYPDKEEIDVKIRLDHELICLYYIIKDELEAADEFLLWRFSEEMEKIKQFKAEFLYNEFTWMHIKNLWDASKENVDLSKSKSDKFLLWLLETDMMANYKIEHIFRKIEKSELNHDVCMFFETHFEIFEDFLYWCTSSLETAAKYKKEKANEIVDVSSLLITYMKENKTEEAEKLLNWAFDSSDLRKKFMQEFLLDELYGLHALKLYVGKHSNPKLFQPQETAAEVRNKLTNFINFFIKPYLNNFEELKSILIKWKKESDDYCNNDWYADPSSDNPDSEVTGDEEETFEYCEGGYNYKLFLELLDSVENE